MPLGIKREYIRRFMMKKRLSLRHRLVVAATSAISLTAGLSAGTLYWDTNSSTAGSGNAGGTWDSGTNWTTDAAGGAATVGWTNGEDVVFSAGTDGIGAWTVNIAGTVNTPSILFQETGSKIISGGTINIGGGILRSSGLALGGSDDIVINSVLAGSGGLTIQAHGDRTSANGGGSAAELRLNGVNTFTGGLQITRGLVSFTADTAFGNAANAITLNGGGILYNGGTTASINRSITIGGSGGTFRLYGGSNVLNVAGSISGSGEVLRTDGGTLNINSDLSGYTGQWSNLGGDTTFSTANLSGMTLNSQTGGRVLFTNAGTTTIKTVTTGRDLFVNNSGRLNIVNGASGVLNFVTGAGFWVQRASGTGSLTSSSGSLIINSGGAASGTLTTSDQRININIVDFDGVTPLAVTKNNVNSLVLNQANTYTGGTTINAGRIDADNTAAFGTGTVTVSNGGQAFLTQAGTYANHFVINGNGAPEAAGTLGAIRFNNGSVVSGNVTVNTASRITVHTSSATGTLTGALLGSANLEINSSAASNNGTVNINGNASGYTGTATVSQGRLNLNSSNFGGSLVVADGATLGGESTLAGNLTFGSATGANLRVDGASAGAVSSTNLTFAGTGNLIHLDVVAPGTITLANYTGVLSGLGNVALANASSYRNSTIVDTGNSLTVNLGALGLTWTGATNANWDVNTSQNWTDGSPQNFFNGDSVTFDNTGANKTISLVGTLQTPSITVNNSGAGNDYTLGGAGALAGIGVTITKNGTGNLTLGGTSNTYSGTINANAGVITLGSQTGFGQNSIINIASGGRINLNGQTAGALATGGYSWTIAGDGGDGAGGLGAITNSGGDVFGNSGVKNLTLSGNAEVGGNNGRFDIGLHPSTGAGVINGGGFTLTKVGSNQIVVRAPSSNITFNIDAGQLTFEDFNTASGSNLITVNNTATLSTFGGRTIANNVTFTGSGTLQNNGGGNGTWTGTLTASGPTLTMNTGSGTIVIDGALAGTGNVTRNGGNTLVLQNSASGFSGKINNTAGALRVEANAAIGTATGTDVISMGAGTTLQGGTISSLASTTIGSSTQGITHSGGGTVFYDSGAGNTLTIAGSVTGGVSNLATQNGTVAFSAGVTLSDPANTLGDLVVRNNSKVSFLNGANANVRQLRLGEHAAGTSSNMDIAAGATVTTTRFVTGDGGSVSSVINQTGGALNITGTNNSNNTSASILFGHWGGGTTNYNLSGGEFNASATLMSLGWDTAGANFNVSGGTANLLGINLGNGRNNAAAVNLTGGRINLGANGINDASNKSVNLGGGTMGAFANWSSTKAVNLSGTGGDVTFNTLDSVDGTTARTITLSAAVNGTGGLVKAGAGTLVLANAANGFSGTAVVQGGKLHINNAGSGTVRSTGSGVLQPGTVSSAANATVANLTLDGGTAMFRIGSSSDRFTVSSSFAVNSASALEVAPAGQLFVNDTFTLIDYTGTIGGSGFSGLSLNALPNPHYGATLVNNTGNTSVDVQITDITPIIWRGSVNGNWDIDSTANWITEDDSLSSKYYTFDVVKFDNDSPSGTINLSGTITPALLNVNSSNSFTFAGSSVGGSGNLVKDGSGGLTLLNSNTYTGSTSIQGGSVTVGNGGTTGTLGGIGDITVATGASLIFDRSDTVNIGRRAVGGGTLVHDGGGTLSTGQAGNNVNITVNSGTFQALEGGWATTYFASSNRDVTINGGTFVTSVHSLGGLGGTYNRPNMIINNGGTWQLNGEQYMDAGDITLNGGTILVTANDLRLQSGTMTVQATSGGSNISRTGSGSTTLFDNVTFNVADGTAAADLTVSTPINQSGTRGITKQGAGTMVISGTASYTGTTTVAAGVLAIAGPGSLSTSSAITVTGGELNFNSSSNAGNVTLSGNGAALSGSGSGRLGNVAFTLASGTATLDPGNSIGTLNTGSLALNGNTISVFEIAKNGMTLTNDLVSGSGSDALTFGGLLQVVFDTTHTDALSVGDTFTLFSGYDFSSAGSFASLALVDPGSGYVWDTSNLSVNGSITVAIPEPGPVLLAFTALIPLFRRRR